MMWEKYVVVVVRYEYNEWCGVVVVVMCIDIELSLSLY
jgi:hypothetical protein